MKKLKILAFVTFFVSFMQIDLMASDNYRADTIYKLNEFNYDKSSIKLKWTSPIINEAYVRNLQVNANPNDCALKKGGLGSLTTVSATKLVMLAQANVNRYVGNDFKTGFNLNNDRETFEKNHKEQIKILIDPMSLWRNFNYRQFRDLDPIIFWQSNDEVYFQHLK